MITGPADHGVSWLVAPRGGGADEARSHKKKGRGCLKQ